MTADLKKTAYDPELQLGAQNAVNVCLRVKPSERVTVITDHACEEIAASLVAELERTGCDYHTFVLEELAPRPLVDMPRPILEDLAKSQLSIFAVHAQANDLKTRMQMCDVVNQY